MCALFLPLVEICKHRPSTAQKRSSSGGEERRDKFCICRVCIIAACLFTKVTPEECKFFIKQICRRHLSAKSSSGARTPSETFLTRFAWRTTLQWSAALFKIMLTFWFRSQRACFLFAKQRSLALSPRVRMCVCVLIHNELQTARYALPPRVYLSTSWVYCEIPPSPEMRRV